jgi:hypothetical protein
LCFIPIVVAKTSGPSFACYFIGAILGTTLIAVRYLATHSEIGRRIVIVAIFLCLAVVTPSEGPSGRESELRQARDSYERLVDQIIALKTLDSPSVGLIFEDSVAGYHNLSLIHFAKTGQVLNPGRIEDINKPEKFSNELRAADFIVTLTPTAPDVEPGYRIDKRFAASRDLMGGDRIVSLEPSMLRVGSFPWKNGQLNLYRNSAPSRPPT